MAQNLRKRLQHIRTVKKNETLSRPQAPSILDSEWSYVGYQVYTRVVGMELPFPIPQFFSDFLSIIIPDLYYYGSIPNPEALVFFDLETTGLSGGAGTLAFLASFGRFKKSRFVVEQYLLLDYPGEGDFVEALKTEILKPGPAGMPSLIVSYNGKTFDSQIFKTRCLMNAIVPPEYFHADLLHPSRRLWKHLLSDCSQGTIETKILGLDRSGDIPGAMAPEIWFSFLKSGDPSELMGICTHNLRDILGLAALILLMDKIAASPLETLKNFNFDLEALALLWRETFIRQEKGNGKQAEDLLRVAAERLMPKALYVYGLDLIKSGEKEKGRHYLNTLASSVPAADPDMKAAAFRALAIDAEWRQRDLRKALEYTESALTLHGIKKTSKEALAIRKERLLMKNSSPEGEK